MIPPNPKNNNPPPKNNSPPKPRPDFCSKQTIEFDATAQTQVITYQDIQVHLQLLGLIQVGVSVDVSLVIKIALGTSTSRRQFGSGNNGPTIINVPGGKTTAKTTRPQQPQPQQMPQGVLTQDPAVIRQALVRQYTVQCSYSYRYHRGVQVTTSVSIAACLQTCTRSAFAAVAGRRPQECLGASLSSVTNQCWYVVGEARSTLDFSVGRADDSVHSVYYGQRK